MGGFCFFRIDKIIKVSDHYSFVFVLLIMCDLIKCFFMLKHQERVLWQGTGYELWLRLLRLGVV